MSSSILWKRLWRNGVTSYLNVWYKWNEKTPSRPALSFNGKFIKLWIQSLYFYGSFRFSISSWVSLSDLHLSRNFSFHLSYLLCWHSLFYSTRKSILFYLFKIVSNIPLLVLILFICLIPEILAFLTKIYYIFLAEYFPHLLNALRTSSGDFKWLFSPFFNCGKIHITKILPS